MRRLGLVLLSFALLVAGIGAADARRMKFAAAIDVDTGVEHVVKVLELPDVPEFRSAGGFFDLGYLMRSDGTGEWVGYIGSKTSYIPFGPRSITYVMEHARLDRLPPEPTVDLDRARPATQLDMRLVLWLMVPVLLLIAAVVLLKQRPKRVRLPKEVLGRADGGAEWMNQAHASVNAAAPPIESPIIRAARERAERLRSQTPAVRGQIAKSPELLNRPDFGRLGGRAGDRR